MTIRSRIVRYAFSSRSGKVSPIFADIDIRQVAIGQVPSPRHPAIYQGTAIMSETINEHRAYPTRRVGVEITSVEFYAAIRSLYRRT
jgi:hypothetical protein